VEARRLQGRATCGHGKREGRRGARRHDGDVTSEVRPPQTRAAARPRKCSHGKRKRQGREGRGTRGAEGERQTRGADVSGEKSR
jgi:hypothetical protein